MGILHRRAVRCARSAQPHSGNCEMSILGIGPLLAIVGAIAALIVIVLEKVIGFTLSLPAPWRVWAFALGVVLMAVGVVFWLSSAVLVKKAYGSYRLTTTNVYGISRNPMYAGFIIFIIPGIALALNNLTLFLVAVAMFVAFKLRIGLEEVYLAKEFGLKFDEYRRSVSQLIPFIRI